MPQAERRNITITAKIEIIWDIFIGHKEIKGDIGHHAVRPYREKDNT